MCSDIPSDIFTISIMEPYLNGCWTGTQSVLANVRREFRVAHASIVFFILYFFYDIFLLFFIFFLLYIKNFRFQPLKILDPKKLWPLIERSQNFLNVFTLFKLRSMRIGKKVSAKNVTHILDPNPVIWIRVKRIKSGTFR